MAIRSERRGLIPALVFALVFGPVGTVRGGQSSELFPAFETFLKTMSSGPADACRRESDFSDTEFHLFEEADKAVTQRLNQPISGAGRRQGATETLTKLEGLSARINRSWPEEKRFHFKVLDAPPALLVKMTYRNRATFSFFAVPDHGDANKPSTLWRKIYALDDHRYKPGAGYDWLDLFLLQRGPAGKVRFLADFGGAGCGSGVSVGYYAYEWNSRFTGLNEVLKLEGAMSREESEHPSQSSDSLHSFLPIGKLRTAGPLIALPYCWFSAIDTYDNPSLCAVDSFDISGDRIRFVDSVTNRPDLLPVAKAIQYAQARDYPAVLAWCGSVDVALRITQTGPQFEAFSDDLGIQRISASKESVEIQNQRTFHFDVEKRGDRWLVVFFRID